MTPPGLPRTGIRLVDLFLEALVSVTNRPSRLALSSMSIAIGTALLVATIGLSTTGAAVVSGAFASQESGEMTVLPVEQLVFPTDTDQRLLPLNGVEAAGITASVSGVTVENLPGSGQGNRTLMAASGGAIELAGAEVIGASFDPFHQVTAARVSIVPAQLAAVLTPGSVVYLDGLPFTVIGGFEPEQDDIPLTSRVVVPYHTALGLWGELEDVEVTVEADTAAVDQLRQEIPLALFPARTDAVQVLVPPRATVLRSQVENTLGTLGYVLGILAVAIGVVAIGTAVLLSVLERRHEIGVRRTLGATGLHIASQVLVESFLMGLVGGLMGTIIGVAAVVLVSTQRGWVPIVPTWTITAAAAGGALIGLLAGILPSLRAARIEPIEVLRA